jgi:small subunit ribosomal protein S16
VATKIKLQRLGKMREPHYRIVIADARNKRDGRVIESIGQYHPKSDPSVIVVDGERAKYWLGVGAQPTEAVLALLKVTGDWQDFKGLPAPPPMLFAPPKPDKKALYEAAVLGANAAEDKPALTPRAKKAAPKTETPAETPAAAPEAPAAAEAPAAEAAPAEAAPEA